jgi:N-methylhydantoinase A
MLMTDLRVDFVQTAITRTDRIDHAHVTNVLTELEREARGALRQEGIASDRVVILRSADMRYLGQEHTVRVALPGGLVSSDSIPQIEERFHQLHEQHYTFRLSSPVELVNFHVAALGLVEKPALRKLEPHGLSRHQALKGHRQVDFDELGRHESAIYEREHLGAGARVEGPAVVEEPAASTVLFPDDRLSVDDYGNLLVEVGI